METGSGIRSRGKGAVMSGKALGVVLGTGVLLEEVKGWQQVEPGAKGISHEELNHYFASRPSVRKGEKREEP